MSRFQSLPDDKLNGLLSAASARLGTSPQALQEQLQSGKVEKLLGRLTPQQAQMFSDIISDPKRLEATLASPQVTAMLKKVLGGK